VEVDRITVRAVGTAFNVRRDQARLDVMVTEGRVRVASGADAAEDTASLIAAGAGLRVSARADATEAVMETRVLTVSELDGLFTWRSPLLEFSRAALPDVLAAFARQRAHRVRLGDPVVAARTISGTFQADNIDGFLRLAEATLDLRVERRPDGEILLLPSR
jgi:transmembrane sensor